VVKRTGSKDEEEDHYNCLLFIILPPVTECARDAEEKRMCNETSIDKT